MRKTGNELRDDRTGRMIRQVSHGNICPDLRQRRSRPVLQTAIDVTALDDATVTPRLVLEVNARKAPGERRLPHAHDSPLGMNATLGDFLLQKFALISET